MPASKKTIDNEHYDYLGNDVWYDKENDIFYLYSHSLDTYIEIDTDNPEDINK